MNGTALRINEGLHDGRGRAVDYLRLSVTPRCNLRCRYCLPDGQSFGSAPNLLPLSELARLARVFVGLGVSRIRLTGGEPLVRRDLPQLVGALAALPGVADLSLTTNGVLLGRQADALAAAGLNRINVSLDALDRRLAATIAGADVLPRVLAGLEAAQRTGLAPVKINTVVARDVNEQEVLPIARLCAERGYTLRLIEPMPMGNRFSTPADMTAIRAQLTRHFDLIPCTAATGAGPARYYVSRGGDLRIGFITPLSQHFCADCNRVRLTAEGVLHTCLDEIGGVDLASQPDAAEVRAAILRALAAKPAAHTFMEQPLRMRRTMATTGG